MVITRSQRFDTYDPVGRFEAEDLDAGTESAVRDLDQIGVFLAAQKTALRLKEVHPSKAVSAPATRNRQSDHLIQVRKL